MQFTDTIFTERSTLFVEVLLPLSLGVNYTYRVPFELNDAVEIGKRVVVQFGKSRIYTALIYKITTQAPQHYQAKYIIDVVDEQAIVNPVQFEFWSWLAHYYMCNDGEVMAAALPSSLKLASETVLSLNDEWTDEGLNAKEQILITALQKKQKITVDEVAQLLGQKTVYPIVNNLISKEVIVAFEEVKDKYKPLLKPFVKLQNFYQDEENLKQLFNLLEKAPKQLDILMAYLKLSKNTHNYIAQDELLSVSEGNQVILKALVNKGIFDLDKRQVSRLVDNADILDVNFQLSEAQTRAFEEINQFFEQKDVVLLHGITSSGKTQIYIKQIEQIIANGNQALFLLPEIALTTQIVERLRVYFAGKIGVYHSKFNDNERVEIWNKVQDGTYQIVLGARSAIFLPFRNLKLIIVDEEHESSYKQQNPAPRYHARDAAIYLAHLHHSKVLLGSATPSIESYYNAKSEKYGLVELNERFGLTELPTQQVVSIAEETQQKKMTSFFTSVLVNQIAEKLENKEQIILFQNRRGYATILLCVTCGYAPKCVNCDVNLTYHKSSGKLHCHYCGYYQNSLKICPACGSVHISPKGFGTERVEEELNLLFPDVTTARLDLDTTRSKNNLQKIIHQFQDKKIDVLIGTQMVAKGLDFDNVSLIGIINADTLLNYPDFRAYERSYQLLTQVSGRAGRRNKQGNVCIQAYATNHKIIQHVVAHNYLKMYEEELLERENFNYPPFVRLIFLEVRHRDIDVMNQSSLLLANLLKSALGKRVLGPEQPLVAKIRNYYIKQIIIKIDRKAAIQKVKQVITQSIQELNTQKEFRNVQVVIDVDPY